jgi:hypothetical protein
VVGCAQAASAAQTQSELAMRVSTWRQRVAPSLEAEDERPVFDIHSYGQMVLQRAAGERGELVRSVRSVRSVLDCSLSRVCVERSTHGAGSNMVGGTHEAPCMFHGTRREHGAEYIGPLIGPR